MNSAGSVDDLAFVVDEAGLTRNARLISAMGARCLPVAQLRADDIADCRVLAVDVDLKAAANVKLLRDALRGRRDGYLHVFAVDLSRRLETVHAHVVGATELLRRPFEARELHGRINAFRQAQEVAMAPSIADVSIASAADAIGDMFGALTTGGAVQMPSIVAAGSEVVDAIGSMGFPTWVETVRQHHEGTFQHCIIVTGLASAFGKATGMSRRDTVTLTTAGLLHDIGKAAVPVAILDKPGRLTPDELAVIRTHPGRGYDYLLAQPGIDPDLLAVVRGHHEYLDGSGYPDRLQAVEIGDLTRILTICDVYGAMIESRSYKPPKSAEEAMAVLDEMVLGGKLEGPLVRAFQHAIAA
jgi:HD-GYP domain-containing protein (c-di-GMP phosphodiesterase class II)